MHEIVHSLKEQKKTKESENEQQRLQDREGTKRFLLCVDGFIYQSLLYIIVHFNSSYSDSMNTALNVIFFKKKTYSPKILVFSSSHI